MSEPTEENAARVLAGLSKLEGHVIEQVARVCLETTTRHTTLRRQRSLGARLTRLLLPKGHWGSRKKPRRSSCNSPKQPGLNKANGYTLHKSFFCAIEVLCNGPLRRTAFRASRGAVETTSESNSYW